jgi:hypothetical protein
VKPYNLSYLNRSKHPVRMARNVKEFVQGILDWRKSLHCAEEKEEYAMRHDSGNFFKVPMYYITKQSQVDQLKRIGFEVLSIYDGNGKTTTASEPDSTSSWIFHACRKPA